MLAIAACAAQPGKLTIRPTGTPLSTGVKPVSARLAEGRSQYALGNVALALESFRRAVREEPGNIDAITGVAACYDRMGRYDLSRKHYEAALAVEPGNVQTLAAFAASLNLQGMADEEASVRGEIRQRSAATVTAASTIAVAQLAPTHSAAAAANIETIPFGDDVQPVRTPPAAMPGKPPAQVQTVQTTPNPVRIAQALPVVRAPSALPTAPARSITVMLAPPREASPPVATQTAATAPARVRKPTAMAVTHARNDAGPRLERTSMGEVALVTRRAEPMFRAPAVRVAQANTIRFVPLRQAQSGVPVRVLNAARIDRLAANTRSLMVRRGWKNIVIGNAAALRVRSIVLYPANVRLAAQRLAAQLGFPSALRAGKGEVTILLGSDAAAAVRRRAAT
jgi:hypothetical protein